MKKFISICVTIMMLLTMLPLNVFATGNPISATNELTELACEVFPEYATAIRGEKINSALPRSANPCEVVHRVTKDISEEEALDVFLLARGDAVVVHTERSGATVNSSISTTDIGSVGEVGTATFTVAWQGYEFVLSNVRYYIYLYADDYFNNYGSVTRNSFYSYREESTKTTTRFGYVISVSQGNFFNFRLELKNNKLEVTV